MSTFMAVGYPVPRNVSGREVTAFTVLAGISVSHLLNDTIQSLLPAIYPMLKDAFALSFAQVGLMTLSQQVTASLLQPVVGLYADRRSSPYALAGGMVCSLIGLLLLAGAPTFGLVVAAAGLMGIGSAVFHPEASRIARLASGGRHGLAQSLFQVGGNAGSSIGPLIAAFFVVSRGRARVAWCALLALVAIAVLVRIGDWHRDRSAENGVGSHVQPATSKKTPDPFFRSAISRRRVGGAMTILLALIFSKYFYLASLNSYYTFYLIEKFHVSVRAAQIHLFVFLVAVAAGTILGGPVGDRFGRRRVIWGSILGPLPFTLILPHANLFWTPILAVVIGIILASAFSAIVVYAQDLVPGRVGLISGVFFGFAFGMGGLGAALLGKLADASGIEFVYRVCAFLPAIGLLALFLPEVD